MKLSYEGTDLKAGIIAVAAKDKPEAGVSLRVSDYPDDIVLQMAAHGLKQIVGDLGASKEITPEEWVAKVTSRHEAMLDGEFVVGRVAGERGPSITASVRAYHNFVLAAGKDVTLEQVAEKWATYDKDKQKAIRSLPKFKPFYICAKAEMAEERARRAVEKAKDADVVHSVTAEDLKDF